ncbi:MAG: glycosyltransferase family 2 protein [Planctomycetes bacterium]|nr:glycosyltransferase family 2 protein [Planctomycetota bacterium]
MTIRALTALPVFNEERHVKPVLDEVRRYGGDVLVVDDGSTDRTSNVLAGLEGVAVVRHRVNRGYGAALRSAFAYAIANDFDFLVTVDCDGQHEPRRIPEFLDAIRSVDIVSGSRYLVRYEGDAEPPADRRRINERITEELNFRLGLELTDAFCGFKAYRVESLRRLALTEDGYAMPLELWVQAASNRLRIVELPVPRIYLEEARSFGGSLDNAGARLLYYREVLDRSIATCVGVGAIERDAAVIGEAAG